MTDLVTSQASVTDAAAVAAPVQDSDEAAFAALGMSDPVTTNQPEPGAQAPATVEPQGTDGDVEIDLTPLQLQGVPKSVLDALPKSALQEWSAQAKERETKRSTDFQQRSEEAKQAKAEAAKLRDELGRFTKGSEATTNADRKATADVDLDALFKPIVDKLRSEGVDVGEQLASAIKAAQLSQSAKVEGLSTVNQQLVGEMLEFFVDETRSKLAAQYPQLSNDETNARVREELNAELQSGRYKEMSLRAAISKAYDKSARVVLFDDILKSHVEKVQSNHRERLAGQPTAPSRQPAARALTPEERDDRIADLLIAGKPEEAQQFARG
jgi:hypothetical protein